MYFKDTFDKISKLKVYHYAVHAVIPSVNGHKDINPEKYKISNKTARRNLVTHSPGLPGRKSNIRKQV